MKLKLWRIKLLTTFVMVFTGLTAYSQKSIYVLSDAHVMAPSLLVSDGTAWQRHLAGQRKLIDYSAQLFDGVMDEILDLKPDMVLITGDLTKDGEVASHQYVRDRLDQLKAAGIATYVIPGNHDRGEQSLALSFNGSQSTRVPTLSNAEFKSFYQDYGYSSELQDEASLSYVCEPFDGLCLIGIDSGVDGVLQESTIDWVCQQAADASNRGLTPIAMMHHALVPHVTNADAFVSTFVVNQDYSGDQSYEEIKKRFVEAGIRVIFTGHFHVSDNATDYDSEDTSGKAIFDISTGSIISYPCDFHVVTMEDDWSAMDVSTRHITSLEGVDDFVEEAKERLWNSIQTVGYSKIDNLARERLSSGLYKVYTMLKYSEKLAKLIADAFIENAEGNEEVSETAAATKAELDNNFNLASNMGVSGMNSIRDMIHSMLENRSPFGTARENITDDHELHISGLSNWNPNTVLLFNNRDNSPMLEHWDGRQGDVLIYGRRFEKTGCWNTLCLPFSMDEEVLAASPLADATIVELTGIGVAELNTLGHIVFSYDEVKAVEAGKPYLIRWEQADNSSTPDDELDDELDADDDEIPVVKNTRMHFKDVVISNELKPAAFDLISLNGCFSPVPMTAGDKSVRIVGENNYMYYPADDTPVNAFRAFFRLDGSIVESVKRFDLNEGEPTQIDLVNDTGLLPSEGEVWYDLCGRRLSGKPQGKGLYIKNHQKYFIR